MLHTETYQNQITNLLEAERNQLEDIDLENLSWDSLLKDEEETGSAFSRIQKAETLDEMFEEYGVAQCQFK